MSASKALAKFAVGAFAVIGLVLMITAAFFFGSWWSSKYTPTSRFVSQGAVVEQVRALKLWTVLSFKITDAVEAEHAERRGMWIVRGSADYVVDFAQAQILDRNESTRSLRLRLPSPAVRNPALDPVKTRLLTYEKTGWGWWTAGALGSKDEFETKSRSMLQEQIAKAAGDADLLDAAKAQAERMARAVYEPVGWSVAIEWGPAVEPAVKP